MTSTEIDALWTIDEPVAGYKALSDALEKHPDSAAELHTQIARALGLQGRFNEGWDELAHVSSHPSDIVRVRAQLESGRLNNSSGDRNAAKPCFLNALQRAVHGHFDYYAVDAAHMLGIVTTGQESLVGTKKPLPWRQSRGTCEHRSGAVPCSITSAGPTTPCADTLKHCGDSKRLSLFRRSMASHSRFALHVGQLPDAYVRCKDTKKPCL